MTRKSIIYLVLLTAVVLLSLPLFFSRLGASSLVSWDEAWYGAIAKNILATGNPLNLQFNGLPFADHPPAGFWLMAASLKILGVSELAARIPSAVMGLLTILVVFLLGLEIATPAVGLASGIALLSSPWFISRARSGNLDIPLTFFFTLTFYLAVKASSNRRYLLPFGLILGLLLLTKTLVPLTIIPALLVIFWKSPLLKTRGFKISLSCVFLMISVWLISQMLNYPHFLSRYLAIGFPQTRQPASVWENILSTKTYLHYGIGTWFRPLILSLPLSVLLIRRRKFLAVLVFIATFLFPFAFSARGQIWHLIPVFPFLIITFFTVFYFLAKYLVRNRPSFISALMLTFALIISLPQIFRNWHEFINIPPYVSDEAILSREASKYPYPLTIDDRFLPVAVYYSGKTVIDGSAPDVNSYFSEVTPRLLITHQWRLDNGQIPPSRYQTLKNDRDMVLILIPAD